MVDPVTLGVIGGSAVAGGIANYMSSQDAAKATKKQLARMEAIANAIQDPKFDTRLLSLDDYELAAKYIPELASYIEEQAPQLAEASSPDAMAGRAAQMAALDRYRNLGATGEDVQSKLLNAQALKAAQIQNQGQQGAIQQNFAQRGIGGSGMEYVQALMAQQGAGQQASNAAQNSAMQAYNTRLNALREGAELGGQIRGEDVDLSTKNAAAMNDYNQRMAASRNQYAQGNADIRNRAQAQNIAAQQAVMNANTAQKNQYRQDRQTMLNNLENQKFNAAAQKAGLRMGVAGQGLQNIQNNAASNANMINSLSGAAIMGAGAYGEGQERDLDRQNRLQVAALTGKG